jgi:glycosyltransferase involved in cell wall biosynthesis
MERLLSRSTSAYFGVAEAQRPYLTKGLGCPADKIHIIHNGVDPARFEVSSDRTALAEFDVSDGDPVVGIVGALRPEKDHATLLRAARMVIDELPRSRFVIVGDGSTRPVLESLCTELGISANVHFAGMRSNIPDILRAIDVFTLCSTTECAPIALLEAMACARPAVCTAVGGIPEVLVDGETGFLVPSGDPQRLAARLVTLLDDPLLARRMGLAGRERVESDFTLDVSVARAQDAIEEVAYGKTTSRDHK